jgi:hypothetical protein
MRVLLIEDDPRCWVGVRQSTRLKPIQINHLYALSLQTWELIGLLRFADMPPIKGLSYGPTGRIPTQGGALFKAGRNLH